MNQKELTKTFMMISNWKKPFDLQGIYLKIQRFEGWKVLLKTLEMWPCPTLKGLNIIILLRENLIHAASTDVDTI